MSLQTISPHILIQVPKKTETERREKTGSIYLPPTFVWMTRNTQCGVIVNLSNEAKKQFPMAKEGHVLICHHFVQGSMSILDNTQKYLAYEDEEHRYYNVTSKELCGTNNQSYAIFDGENIIPHKDFVFLETEEIKEQEEVHPLLQGFTYKKTDDDILGKTKAIQHRIMHITQSNPSSDKRKELQGLEKEMEQLSKSIHQQEYIPYKIAHINPSFSIPNGTVAYCRNYASRLTIEFNGKEYRICETRYMGAIS